MARSGSADSELETIAVISAGSSEGDDGGCDAKETEPLMQGSMGSLAGRRSTNASNTADSKESLR